MNFFGGVFFTMILLAIPLAIVGIFLIMLFGKIGKRIMEVFLLVYLLIMMETCMKGADGDNYTFGGLTFIVLLISLPIYFFYNRRYFKGKLQKFMSVTAKSPATCDQNEMLDIKPKEEPPSEQRSD